MDRSSLSRSARHTTDALLSWENIQLVFTVLYEFDSQPIENVWRDVRGVVVRLRVVRQYYPGRTIGETRKQLLKAFYSHITPRFFNDLIKSSEEYINQLIAKDPEFKHLGKLAYFKDPPVVHRSDEIIDLTF